MTSTDVRPDDGPAASRDDASPGRRGRLAAAAGVGVLTGALTLAVADLVAGFVQPAASPVLAVGAAFIDRTPGPLKDFAVATFGSYDKLVLLAGMAVALAGLSAAAGVLARRRMVAGLGLVCLLGAVAAAAALSRPGAGPVWAVPTAVGVLAGLVALRTLTAMLTARQRAEASTGPEGPAGTSRRSLLAASGGVLGLAAVSAAGGRWLATRARGTTPADVVLPTPRQAAGPVPAGAQVDARGMPAFVTDNAGFYRVDTNLAVPRVDAEGWSLRLHGMVDTRGRAGLPRPARAAAGRALDHPDLRLERGRRRAAPATHAGWASRSPTLLAEAGVREPARTACSRRSVDGFTVGTPLAALTDGRDALLAVGMNGEPLPLEHGFPVRMVVPGLYGYVSATKWVVELEVTRFDRRSRRTGPRAAGPRRRRSRRSSRIDVPGAVRARCPPGTVAVAGSPGRSTGASTWSRCGSTAGRGSSEPHRLRRARRRRHLASVAAGSGTAGPGNHTLRGAGRPTPPARCRPETRRPPSRTAPPAGTRSRSRWAEPFLL